MPTTTANVTIISDHISGKINAARLLQIPVDAAISRWLDMVVTTAKHIAPKDTEGLAESIRKYVGAGSWPRAAGIQSGSRKFWFVHGAVVIPAPVRHQSEPHFPPPSQSLRNWALRHGIPLFLVQKSIADKGTPIIPFLSEAVDQHMGDLDRELARAASDVGKEWSA